MNTLTQKTQGVTLDLEKVREIFAMSSRIADDAESVLEDNMAFSPKFLQGLNASLEDSRKGEIKKIGSLREILPR